MTTELLEEEGYVVPPAGVTQLPEPLELSRSATGLALTAGN
jgi:hypothetical protein